MDPPVRRRHRDLLGNRLGPRRRVEGATHPSAIPPASRSPGSELREADWADWTQGQSRPDGLAFADPVGFRQTRQMPEPTEAPTRRNCRKTPAQRQRAGVRRVSMSGDSTRRAPKVGSARKGETPDRRVGSVRPVDGVPASDPCCKPPPRCAVRCATCRSFHHARATSARLA
jgi:hypothetical protein